MDNISGKWKDCKIKGVIVERNGLPFFTWDLTSSQVSVKMFISDELKYHQDRLDNFEGKLYKRILIPVQLNDRIRIANIFSENEQEY